MPNYNVWNISCGRWFRGNTSKGIQHLLVPYPLTYEEANKTVNTWKGVDAVEVREIGPDGKSPGPVVSCDPTPKVSAPIASNGMKCAGCGDFNSYGEPNCPNGDYKCFSCRRR